MMNPKMLAGLAFAGIAMLQLAACGGGGGSEGGTGHLSASITDAAVDDLKAVNLRVIALELRLQGAGEDDWVVVDVRDEFGAALEFNLLDYQHGATFPLFEDERVPAGVYEHARLVLEAPARTPGECIGQDPLAGSHVVVDQTGALVPLFVPSGANTGVKLASPFRVPVDGFAAVVIDFDLRQALHQPAAFRNSCYFLRPAFRVEAVQNTGRIAGTVALPLLDGSSGLCSDHDPMTGNAVYVYQGWNRVPGDINADETVPTAAPFATSAVTFDATGEGSYTVAFLPPGDYTVAFTCRADEERLPDPDAADEDERLAVDELDFQQPQNAVVEAQVTTVVNFPAD
ncbi:putative lipoprotein [Thioalkalivibrio nitratireducens DSM 14787]|uniref:Lipoprotein n=1 Tax=Thioalkalivibrio nitratireducens (strain DSM 14787 / UNIQEM 213 / ALEN2) TaxID=1255043 RepID=L0E1L4_THIND|nr:DUF4382 domain-containing protein [Thioalkalivibrio nitratireducens]AGA35188.1 putative lipoprotein [Thioalkalivibrio nitratireducens DSM 14787]